MTKHYCDMKNCNAEINPYAHVVRILDKNYEFCDKCFEEFSRFVESKLQGGDGVNVAIPPSNPFLQSPQPIQWVPGTATLQPYTVSYTVNTAQPNANGDIFPGTLIGTAIGEVK